MSQRLIWYRADDARLLAQCELDTYRASGPGGQKRNKTSSAVRLRHLPSGLIVIAEESRSQHDNKAKAIRRMRQAFMLKIREPLDDAARAELAAHRDADGKLHFGSAKDPDFWPAAALLLDQLEGNEAKVSDAAALLGTSTGNLLSILEMNPKVWEQANIIRRKFGQKPLKI
jgi:hypothetical protein